MDPTLLTVIKSARGRKPGYLPKRVYGKIRKRYRDPTKPTQREQLKIDRENRDYIRPYKKIKLDPCIVSMQLRVREPSKRSYNVDTNTDEDKGHNTDCIKEVENDSDNDDYLAEDSVRDLSYSNVQQTENKSSYDDSNYCDSDCPAADSKPLNKLKFDVDGELPVELNESSCRSEWECFIKRSLPKKKKLYPSTDDPSIQIEKFSHGKQWIDFLKIYRKGIIPEYYGMTKSGKIPEHLLNKVMVFQPSEEMFEDAERFISFIHYCGGHFAGGAMFIPPNSHIVRKNGYEDILHEFTPYYQEPLYNKKVPGVARFNFVPPQVYKKSSAKKFWKKKYPNRKFTIKSFWEHCKKERCDRPWGTTKHIKEQFWKDFMKKRRIYLKDSLGTLFDHDCRTFNVNNLNTFFGRQGTWKSSRDGKGLRRSYIYCSAYGSLFCDHVEDFASYSLNYMHLGENKTWRFVPPLYALKYIELLKKLQKKIDPSIECEFFPMHKGLMVSDDILKLHNIPTPTIDQIPGAYIITFPFGFHSGYAHGFTLAEASNFAVHGTSWADLIVCHPSCPKNGEFDEEDEDVDDQDDEEDSKISNKSIDDLESCEMKWREAYNSIQKPVYNPGNNEVCKYGTTTRMDVSKWIFIGGGPKMYKEWMNGTLSLHHPYSFKVGIAPLRGINIPNEMPIYPFDADLESKDTGFLLRGILPDNPSKDFLNREECFDIHVEINKLKTPKSPDITTLKVSRRASKRSVLTFKNT